MKRFLAILIASTCIHVMAAHTDHVSCGRYQTESGTTTYHSADPADRMFKPFAEAKFTQPRTNPDMHVEFRFPVECQGDPETKRVDGPISLHFEINDSKDKYYKRRIERQIMFEYYPGETQYRYLQNFATGRNGFVLTTEYTDDLRDKNYLENRSFTLNLLRGVLDNGKLNIEVIEDGRKIMGTIVARPAPHIGFDLFDAMSKCYHGQRSRDSDNPQLVADE